MTSIHTLYQIAHTPSADVDSAYHCQYDTDACPACGRLQGPCDLPFGKNAIRTLEQDLRRRAPRLFYSEAEIAEMYRKASETPPRSRP